MTAFLINIAAFSLFLVIGSLLQCGWYKVTRKGMLCGRWSQYWESITPEAKVLSRELKEYEGTLEEAKMGRRWSVASDYTDRIRMKQLEIQMFKDENAWYEKKPWLISPLSGCIYCYASVYGSLFYWLAGSVFLSVSGLELPLSYQVLVLWVAFVLCSSALNGILIKKVL